MSGRGISSASGTGNITSLVVALFVAVALFTAVAVKQGYNSAMPVAQVVSVTVTQVVSDSLALSVI